MRSQYIQWSIGLQFTEIGSPIEPPNADPSFDRANSQSSVEHLQDMGVWLDANGEAIYDTKPGPIQRQAWRRSMAKPGKVYGHVFDWPEDGKIRLEGVGSTGAHALSTKLIT